VQPRRLRRYRPQRPGRAAKATAPTPEDVDKREEGRGSSSHSQHTSGKEEGAEVLINAGSRLWRREGPPGSSTTLRRGAPSSSTPATASGGEEGPRLLHQAAPRGSTRPARRRRCIVASTQIPEQHDDTAEAAGGWGRPWSAGRLLLGGLLPARVRRPTFIPIASPAPRLPSGLAWRPDWHGTAMPWPA
jgi:hypothetical protein